MEKLSDTIFMLDQVYEVILNNYTTIGRDGVQTINDKICDLQNTIGNISKLKNEIK